MQEKQKQELRIIVAGSRDFDDQSMMNVLLDDYIDGYDKENVVIISGTARGADSMGEEYAKNAGLRCKRFPADWDTYGKRAGYLRNVQMADYAMADNSNGVLYAFWNGESKGTGHMIQIAKSRGLKVCVLQPLQRSN